MKRISLAAALLISSIIGVHSAEDLGQLAALISGNNLADISEKLQSDHPAQWPEIASQVIEKNPEKKQMAKVLLARIIEAKDMPPQTGVPVLSHVAAKLYASGGYSNYVLADTAQRFAIATLLKALIAGDLSPEKAEALAESLSSAFPSTSAWIKTLNQEVALGDRANILNDTQAEDYLKQLYALTGNDNADAIYVRIGSNLTTSSTKLLQERDIAVLARRMAETETYRIAHLGALIFFMQNGGRLQDIDLNDVRNVNEIFSKTQEAFGSPLLRMPRIGAMHLKMLAADVSSNKSPRLLLGYE